MEYLMRNVKLDAPEKHELYVRAFKANRFDSIELPASLPPLNLKPQVENVNIIDQEYTKVITKNQKIKKTVNNLKGTISRSVRS